MATVVPFCLPDLRRFEWIRTFYRSARAVWRLNKPLAWKSRVSLWPSPNELQGQVQKKDGRQLELLSCGAGRLLVAQGGTEKSSSHAAHRQAMAAVKELVGSCFSFWSNNHIISQDHDGIQKYVWPCIVRRRFLFTMSVSSACEWRPAVPSLRICPRRHSPAPALLQHLL